jgi:hypothetical protein
MWHLVCGLELAWLRIMPEQPGTALGHAGTGRGHFVFHIGAFAFLNVKYTNVAPQEIFSSQEFIYHIEKFII